MEYDKDLIPQLEATLKFLKGILKNTFSDFELHVDAISHSVPSHLEDAAKKITAIIQTVNGQLPVAKYSRNVITFENYVLTRQQVKRIVLSVCNRFSMRKKYDNFWEMCSKLELALIEFGDSLENALYYAGMTSEEEFREVWKIFRSEARIIEEEKEKQRKTHPSSKLSDANCALASEMPTEDNGPNKAECPPAAVVPSKERMQKYFQGLHDVEYHTNKLKDQLCIGFEKVSQVIKETSKNIKDDSERNVVNIQLAADRTVKMITEIITSTVKSYLEERCKDHSDFVVECIIEKINEAAKHAAPLRDSVLDPNETFIGKTIHAMNISLNSLESKIEGHMNAIARAIQAKLMPDPDEQFLPPDVPDIKEMLNTKGTSHSDKKYEPQEYLSFTDLSKSLEDFDTLAELVDPPNQDLKENPTFTDAFKLLEEYDILPDLLLNSNKSCLSASASSTEQFECAELSLSTEGDSKNENNAAKVSRGLEQPAVIDVREVIVERIFFLKRDLIKSDGEFQSKSNILQDRISKSCDLIKVLISCSLNALEKILERALFMFSRMIINFNTLELAEFKHELKKVENNYE